MRQEASRHRHDLKERGRSKFAKPPNVSHLRHKQGSIVFLFLSSYA